MQLSELLNQDEHELIEMLATSKGMIVYCENFKSVAKSLEMKKAEMLGASSVAAQEREAYASKTYQKLITDWQQATHDSIVLEYALSKKRV
jgi:hypothetical protein